jgi:hypothetical protein
MIITDEKQQVLVAGAQSVDAFTIKASAKAFQILSSNLYSNPLGSMIRELSTNAYDAHVMVGKADEPFHLTLPNRLEPSFKIRDFGPGLSHNDIMNIYTTFFESTKTNSNDMVGCLGLGSKSPFGVSDSFTVTSFFQGEKTIYSAFLNEDRIPSIALFHKEPTDEPNGLEIEVAINADDFRVFNREVNGQLKYFKTKPLVFGNSNFEWNVEEEYLYSGSNWKMVKGGGSPRVVQGQIQYPINVRNMGKEFDEASDVVRELLNKSVLFEVNIGDVNIAPSREALSYDAKTNQNIIKAAEKILEELPVQIAEAIQSEPSEYLARLKYSEIMNDLCLIESYRHQALVNYLMESGKITWNGIDVSSTTINIDKADLTQAVTFYRNYNGKYSKSILHPYRTWGKPDTEPETWNFEIRSLKSTLWIYATPSDKGVELRAKKWANDHFKQSCSIHVITSSLSLDVLTSKFGLMTSDWVKAKDLPKIVKAPKDSTDKTIYVKQFNDSCTWQRTRKWDTIRVNDLSQLSGYYVALDRLKVLDNGSPVDDFDSIVSGAIKLGLLDESKNIYGLGTQNLKRSHGLIDLFDHIRAVSKAGKVTKLDFGGNETVINKLKSDWKELQTMQHLIDVSSPIRVIIDALLDNKKITSSHDVTKTIKHLGLHAAVVDLSKEAALVEELYPMIGMVSYYFQAEPLATYVAQVDALMTLKNMLPRAAV